MRFTPRSVVLAVAAVVISSIAVVSTPAVARADTQPLIHTLVGGPTDGDGGASTAAFGNPGSVAIDAAGDIFEADDYRIREIVAATGDIHTVVGTGYGGIARSGDPALTAQLSDDDPIFVTPAGQLYFDDDQTVFTVDSDGNLSRLPVPDSTSAVSVGPDGSIFYSLRSACQIFEIPAGSSPQQLPVVYAGDGDCGASGTGIATEEPMGDPTQINIASDGTLDFNDGGEIEQVTTAGQLSTVARWTGSTTASGPPSNGDAATALPGQVQGFDLDPSGDLYLQYGFHDGSAVLQVNADKTVSDVDDLPADGSESMVAGTGSLLVLDRVNVATNVIELLTQPIPGPASPTVVLSDAVTSSPDTSTATQAWFSKVSHVTELSNGDIAFIDGSGAVRVVTTSGALATIPVSGGTPYLVAAAGGNSVDVALRLGSGATVLVNTDEAGDDQTAVAGGGSTAPDATPRPGDTVDLPELADLTVGSDGTVYASDYNDDALDLVSPSAEVTRVDVIGDADDLAWDPIDDVVYVDSSELQTVDSQGQVVDVGFGYSSPLAFGPDGTYYVGEGNAILRVYPNGAAATIAGYDGDGAAPEQGDGIPAFGAAMLVTSLLVESDGSIVISDSGYDRLGLPETAAEIRRIDPGFVPSFPAAPTVTATSPAPGQLELTAPPEPTGERYLVYVVPPGTTLADVYPTYFSFDPSSNATVTHDAEGNIHLSLGFVARSDEPPAPLQGDVTIVAYAVSGPTGNESAHATQDIALGTDTTPPAAPTFIGTSVAGHISAQIKVPSDPDLAYLIVRYTLGSKPVPSPTAGQEAVFDQYIFGEVTTDAVIQDPAPWDSYTFTAWAVDVSGNISQSASQTVSPSSLDPLTRLTATAAAASVKIAWSTPNPYPGCQTIVRWSNTRTAPKTASAGSLLYRGTAASATQPVKEGRDYSYAGFVSCGTTGDVSAPASVTLRGTTISARSTSNKKSGRTRLAADLTRADDHADLDQGLALFRRTGPAARWTRVKTVHGSAAAPATVTVGHRKMQYYFGFAATGGYLASASRVLTVS